MEFPQKIKGVWQSYSGECSDAEVPIEDIEKFTLSHESYRNGLQLRAYIKNELIDKIDSDYISVVGSGKYRRYQTHFTIRGKDMPKFRKLLYIELMKTPTIVVKTGINAGTPAAMSFEIRKKELSPAQSVRQRYRENGKYSKMDDFRCDDCNKFVGQDYWSDPEFNNTGDGGCLCKKCYDKRIKNE